MTLNLSQQRITKFAFQRRAAAAGPSAATRYASAGAGAWRIDLQGLAAASGQGRRLAGDRSANGIENPRLLRAGCADRSQR